MEKAKSKEEILKALKVDHISDADSVKFFGSTLKDMIRFGWIEDFNYKDDIREYTLQDNGVDLFTDLENVMTYKTWTHEYFLISEDSKGNVFLFKEDLNVLDIEFLMILADKHDKDIHIEIPPIDIKLVYITFDLLSTRYPFNFDELPER